MYPLLTNDRSLSDAQVFEAHKRQPNIAKRFEQVKTVPEIAPVLLKNEGRVEALFFLYFLALLVHMARNTARRRPPSVRSTGGPAGTNGSWTFRVGGRLQGADGGPDVTRNVGS